MTLREQIKALVTTIAGDIKAVKASIAALTTTVGSTETLATDAKTSVVDAINEVNTKAAAGVSTESLNAAVASKVTEVVGTDDGVDLVATYTAAKE